MLLKSPSSESAVVHFVRTAAKLFAPGDADQYAWYGVHQYFGEYGSSKGKKNKFVDFSYNRCNIIFVEAAMAFYLSREICEFTQNVFGISNTLLKAIDADSSVSWCVAEAKAIGLLGKQVTSPL